MVSAVVLAGGFGTRLRPLTLSTPKPLVRIAGIPMIDRVLASLPSFVDEAFIAAGYRAQDIRSHFNGKGINGLAVNVIAEEKPLGTAGALWSLRNRLEGDFIVLNGDVINSLPVNEMFTFHRKSGGIATISLWEVDNPENFGIVRLGQDMQITEFKEKPKREDAFSRLINAGTYVMNDRVFDYMDSHSSSMEKEVFPSISGRGLYGFRFSGYWVDCGSLDSYLTAQEILVSGEAGVVRNGARVEGCVISRPVGIERGAVVRGSRIGPNTYIEEKCAVSEGCVVKRSTLMRGAVIGKGCEITNSIIGPGTEVTDGTSSDNQILVNQSQ